VATYKLENYLMV